MAEIIIAGPEGRLEGRFHQAEKKSSPIAVVLHPHPLYGGTMNNKVVYSIYQSFVRCGFSVLRFNFRGVGRSQGKFDDGNGELIDAATALDWLQLHCPDATTCWIGGFSFGSWIAMQMLMRRPEIDGFICASPPANMYDFSFLSPCPASGLIVQGGKDDVVNEEAVSKLAGKLASQKGAKIEYEMMPGADHYFRTCIEKVGHTMDDYINNRMKDFQVKRKVRPDRKRRQLPRT